MKMVLPVCLLACFTAHAGQNEDDVAKVKAYLARTHPGKTWSYGPSRVEGEAVQAMYGRALRFYVVHASPPLPPGAALSQLVERYRERRAQHLATTVSLVMSIDMQGVVRPLRTPKELARGLKTPHTDEQRKTVAAAVASLTSSDRAPAGELRADEVELQRDGAGWVGTAQRRGARMVSVWLDARGRVFRINAGDLVALPPASRPR